MERWEGTRRLARSSLAVLSLGLLSACGRFGFESLPDLGVGGSGILNNGGDASTPSGTGGGGQGGGGQGGGGGGDSSTLLPDGGAGARTCSLGTLADCSACGDDCSTQSLPGVAQLACVSAICTIGSCAPGYDDCDNDPSNGCETALNSLTDCGSCNQPCAIPNAEASCGSGTCQLVACTPGFGDCDVDLATNGCERELNTLTNCGGCGVPCALDNATPSCDTGSCQLVSCANGFDNCDGNVSTGCETPLDTLANCGSCRTLCTTAGGTPSCAGGSCSAASCLPNFADCNGDDDSCETSLLTLTDCVSCGVPCGDGSGRLAHATATCATGSCGVGTCDSGFADCDTSPGNGCETPLNTLLDCGGCDVRCSRANASASCASGSCTTDRCSLGFDDCDGNDSTGCEAQLGSDAHCSGCNDACTANEVCSDGECVGQFITFQPSNVTVGTLNSGAAPNLVLDCGTVTLDTTSLSGSGWCGRPGPSLVVQTPQNSPELLVLPLQSLAIAPGSTLRVTGNRPVVLAVFGDVNVAGTIDVSASGSTGGAGNNWNCDLLGSSNDSNGNNGGDTSSNGGKNGGGGGGAFRASGGTGGSVPGVPDAAGGTGGVARGSDLMSPLIPGCNGGWGGGCGAGPGGGGGALQLAVSGRIDVTGSLLARGGNGVNGCGTSGGATGGGSGGGILLEGNQVFITGGTLLADGGRGGNGANGGGGGLGSASGAGQVGGSSGTSGGGGGGSAGRIRIKGAQGCSLGGTVTPAASTACP